MTKNKAPAPKVQPVNLKEQNARHTFSLTFRDTEHFYRVVNWLNQAVGKGTEKWTCQGHILRHLKTGKPHTSKVYVFVEDFDPASSVYLSLV